MRWKDWREWFRPERDPWVLAKWAAITFVVVFVGQMLFDWLS